MLRLNLLTRGPKFIKCRKGKVKRDPLESKVITSNAKDYLLVVSLELIVVLLLNIA
jgi:hypothetical protein